MYCNWTEQEDYYETECDMEFTLSVGDLKDNFIKFCPFCGKLIKELNEEEEVIN